MSSVVVLLFGLLFCLNLPSSLGLVCWTCTNAADNSECQRKGRPAYCWGSNMVCQTEIRRPNRDSELITKGCKQTDACSLLLSSRCNRNSPLCRCCCSSNFCNQYSDSCGTRTKKNDAQVTVVRPCEPVHTVPLNSDMQCTGNNEPGTTCTFQCHRNYALMGSNKLTCRADGSWDRPLPWCRLIYCPNTLRSPENGYMGCTNKNQLNSVCRFSCGMEYELRGSTQATCMYSGQSNGLAEWSSSTPYCKPIYCSMQEAPKHGNITCTKKHYMNSECTFQCKEGYEVYPASSDQLTCLKTKKWDNPTPCCTLPCPPNVYMDLFVIMDSSSSVGLENWKKMKSFVRSILESFIVSDIAAHYSVIRYNKRVDNATQILLNDYPNDKDALLNAFDRIPYNGDGTNTGRALRYLQRVLLKQGNRKDAKDVVLLITDGAATDRVAIPALSLRKTGAMIYIVPVMPPVGNLDMRELRTIVGRANEEKFILKKALKEGFKALTEDFAQDIGEQLCGNPCEDSY